MLGRNVSITPAESSNSATVMVSALVCSTREIKGVPIFPARSWKTSVFKMFDQGSRRRLTFEPVIRLSVRQETIRQLDFAPDGDTLCARGLQQGRICGHAGLGTIRSCSKNEFSRWPPSSRLTPAVGVAQSLRRFRFPCAHRRRPFAPRRRRRARGHTCPGQSHDQHALAPQLKRFGIFAQYPFPLPQLQRRQRKQRKNQRGDPKPHDHFRFAPTEQFEM